MLKKIVKKKDIRMDEVYSLLLTIYHCEHRHYPADGFGNDVTKKQLWNQVVKNAEKCEVIVCEFLISPLEHQILLILQAPSFQVIETAFSAVEGLADMVVTRVLKGHFREIMAIKSLQLAKGLGQFRRNFLDIGIRCRMFMVPKRIIFIFLPLIGGLATASAANICDPVWRGGIGKSVKPF